MMTLESPLRRVKMPAELVSSCALRQKDAIQQKEYLYDGSEAPSQARESPQFLVVGVGRDLFVSRASLGDND